MPNGGFLPFSRPPETTKVSDETERQIPLRVWRDSCLVGAFGTLCVIAIFYLCSLQISKWNGKARGWGDRAWDFTCMNWPLMSVLILAVWIPFTGVLLYRFWIETETKHGPPVMTKWPAELGAWTSGRARRLVRPPRDGGDSRYEQYFGGDEEN